MVITTTPQAKQAPAPAGGIQRADVSLVTTTRPRPAVLLVGAVMLATFAAPGASDPAHTPAGVAPRQSGPVAYVAHRWLHAESSKLRSDGWLEAHTSYDPASGFSYRITKEGGSERIRKRALHGVLQAEERATDKERRRAAVNGDNYLMSPIDDVGRQRRVRLVPRRADEMLVDGEAVLDEHGCLVRIRGRLAKSPSFWVKWATVVRDYICLGGRAVPVRVESTADVRFAGVSRLVMTYEYESVNGAPVRLRAANRQLGPVLLPGSPLLPEAERTMASSR